MAYSATLSLTKHHGLGNDFLIALLDEEPADLPALTRRLCDRRTGIGADGLIVGLGGLDAPRFILHNADGSRPEVSGNGLRCFGQALLTLSDSPALEVDVATDVGQRPMTVRRTDDPLVVAATVDMGPPSTGPSTENVEAIAALTPRHVGSVDMGNPHVVLHVDEPGHHDMAAVGPAIEANYLPVGANVHLIRPDGDTQITMAIWERGAGVTEACGSGACAAAVVGHQLGLTGPSVDVVMPGGAAHVDVGDTIALTGPATFVAALEVPHG